MSDSSNRPSAGGSGDGDRRGRHPRDRREGDRRGAPAAGDRRRDDSHGGDRRFDRRDDRRGGSRDDRRGGRDGERKPWDKDRKPWDKDRKPWEKGDRRDDRRGGRDDRRDDRRGPKRDGERKPWDKDRKPWEKGDRRDDRRGGRDDRRDDRRGPKRDGDRKPWDKDRRDDRNGPRRDDRNGPRRDDRNGPRRDDRNGPRRDDRRGGPDRRRGGERDRATKTVRTPGPEIPEEITGRELPGEIRSQLRTLEKKNAETVARHLVAAGQFVDVDPQLAYDHARAAADRAARVAGVREFLGLVAYRLEKYDEVLRELRTHRRISGSDDNLAIIADSERGRGKPQKAIELWAECKDKDLDDEVRIETAIVVAGAHADLGDLGVAKEILEDLGFTGHAAGPTVRLLSAYADLLRAMGDEETGDKYEELARRTAQSTGTVFGEEDVDLNEGVAILTIEEEDLEEDALAGAEPVAVPADAAADDSEAEDTAPEAPVESATEATGPAAESVTAESATEEGLTVTEAPAEASTSTVDPAPAEDTEDLAPAAEMSIEDEADQILRDAGIDPDDIK
ncbi:tetratricopeptide repeat protein [Brevibacterium litoralis]|uniref:tetratricopeptide repeat protein n=1 Tax=Brevibacterium litoralis TaxID=3138935 RepID=UPI0032ECC7A4